MTLLSLAGCLLIPLIPQAQVPSGQEGAQAPEEVSKPALPAQDGYAPKVRTEEDWRLREMEHLARIQSLELELAQERALRIEREQEWMAFTQLLSMLPEERRPEVPGFLSGKAEPEPDEQAAQPTEEELREQRALRRAQQIKTNLRAFLRAEGIRSLDLLEVGMLHDGGVGPIVARQLDASGRFLATLVADRLRLEKSSSGFTLTLVLERGYERRAGQTWPFPEPGKVSTRANGEPGAPNSNAAEVRAGILRIPLTGVRPEPWIEAMPELFSVRDRDRQLDDGDTNLIRLKFQLNGLLESREQGARWRLVSLGGVVGTEWRDIHFAELDLQGRVLRRLFADGAELRLEGNNAIFEMRAGAQERAGKRSPFLAGRYTLVLPGIDPLSWKQTALPGI